MAARKKASAQTKASTQNTGATPPAAELEQQNAPTTIQVGDLAALIGYIDVACRRGAYQAPEMAEVGALYNKVASFLKAYNQQVEEARQKAEEE